MHLVVVGLSHKTAPVAIREKLSFPPDALDEALMALTSCDQVAEAVILSTCNRTEVYAVAPDDSDGVDAVVGFLAEHRSLDREEIWPYLYVQTGEAAVRHLFRVVSSLDSMVVGEAQILGQVKSAYERALEAGSTRAVFNKLFRQSFEVGKRVRTETAIGESAVSVSYAAVELAKKVFDTLDGRTVLVLGAGEMSELTVKHLVSNGVEKVLVANRTFERARDMASRFNGAAVPYEHFYESIRDADIVISSTAANGYVIQKDRLASVARHRSRPLFLIDIAVPRDIDPAVNDLPDVFLYDIDGLNGVVEANLEERMAEARRAEGIIDEEIAAFLRWSESMEVVPTVTAIRAKAEVIRQMELEKALKKLDLSDKDRKTVEALTCAIVNKMLHGPTARLKKLCSGKDGYVYVEAARVIYGLDDSEDRQGPGAFRNLLNLRAREIAEKHKQTGEGIGDCGA